MNNIAILLIMDSKNDDYLSTFNADLQEYFKERNYEYNIEDELLVFKINKKEVVVEYKKLGQAGSKYIYNIFYHEGINKRSLLQRIRFNKNIIDSIVLYDTGSNKILNEDYCILSKFENLLKYYIGSQIIQTQGINGFEVIKNFKVKDEIYPKYKKMITALQRRSLKDLIDDMKNKPIGGNELNVLRNLYNNEFFTKEQIESIEEMIEGKESIFSHVRRKIDNFDGISSIYEWRKSIAHNSCIEESLFKAISSKILNLSKEIECQIVNIENSRNKSEFGQDFKQQYERVADLGIVLTSDKKLENILLRVIELYNEFYDENLFEEFIRSTGITKTNRSLVFKSNKFKLDISVINPTIPEANEENISIYKILIYIDDLKPGLNLSNEMFKLLDVISEEYIVLNDSISSKLCCNLYGNINIVENLLRLYIKLSQYILDNKKSPNIDRIKANKAEMKLALDLNALRISTDEKKIDFVNNDLIGKDFLTLLDIISDPLVNISFGTIIKKKGYNCIEEFNKSIADLPAIDENIESLKNKWRDLYNIRNIVAHNFILDFNSYIQYNNMFLESKKEIETAVYNLLKDTIYNYNLNYEINIDKTKISLKELEEKYRLEIVNEEKQVTYYIPINEVWRIIKSVFKLEINLDAIILTTKLIKTLSNANHINSNIEDIKDDLKAVMKYYECNISYKSTQYRILEDEISSLLQHISSERVKNLSIDEENMED